MAFHSFFVTLQQNQTKTTMGKKNGGKRLSKRQVADAVQGLFQAHPNEELSFKQIFKALRLDTHPAKMLAIDVMEEMAWDDYLSKASENSYRLNLKTQVQDHPQAR